MNYVVINELEISNSFDSCGLLIMENQNVDNLTILTVKETKELIAHLSKAVAEVENV